MRHGLNDEESVSVVEVSRFELLEDGSVVFVEGDLSWFKQRGYGDERQDGRWGFSPVETLYLVKNGKAQVYKDGRQLGFNELLTSFIQRDGNVWRDYVIYMDLRKRRYVVKEGFGPKLRFRVFERGEYLEKPAKYLVIPLYEGESMRVEELLDLLRSCRAMNKTAVVAVLDRQNEVVYYNASLVELLNK
uniref:tRNA-intron lyase n=1 Tax=Caldiarchaeum subterraneum TaxID=311458 RepID=A0A7C5QDP6_CALS0